MRGVDARAESLARFVSRLLETPALRPLPSLQKEEQALQFIQSNGPQLQPVFSSLGLERDWHQAVDAVARVVREEAARILAAELSSLARTGLRLSFFGGLTGGRPESPQAREELLRFFSRLADHPVSRAVLKGSLSAALSDLPDKYIAEAWDRKKHIYSEIARVQRLAMPPADVADLLRVVLLLRPGAYLLTTPGSSTEGNAGNASLQYSYVEKITPGVAAQLPSFPAPVVSMGLRSSVPFAETGTVEAVSRLAAVLAARGRSLSPAMVVDRGADTPDKSWFNVTRKNARWHGLDPRLLDELYTIAAENGW